MPELPEGGYNNHILVYDREGEKCIRCGGSIVKTELNSRKCFYCPDCQVYGVSIIIRI